MGLFSVEIRDKLGHAGVNLSNRGSGPRHREFHRQTRAPALPPTWEEASAASEPSVIRFFGPVTFLWSNQTVLNILAIASLLNTCQSCYKPTRAPSECWPLERAYEGPFPRFITYLEVVPKLGCCWTCQWSFKKYPHPGDA